MDPALTLETWKTLHSLRELTILARSLTLAARALLPQLAIVFLALSAGPITETLATDEPAFQVPLGSPLRVEFCGAVGRFEIAARTETSTVEVGKPVLLTLRVTATDRPLSPPRREGGLDLRSDPFFAGDPQKDIQRRFFVEIPEPGEKQIDERTWEFSYRLKPVSTEVKQIPEVALVYFDPAFGQNPAGYQKKYSKAVPVTVTPARPDPVKVQGGTEPAPLPEAVLELAPADEVLRLTSIWQPPGLGVLALLFLAPPAGCLAWYAVWRRLHPDEARRARRQRSRAARVALAAIEEARDRPADEQGIKLADTVGVYLRQRLDLAVAVPTPTEAAEHLARAGAAEDLCRNTFDFFRACDVLRFAPPAEKQAADLIKAAESLVLAVEEQTWALHQS
jgi:hypothetical protein